jgi:hypothetical protein
MPTTRVLERDGFSLSLPMWFKPCHPHNQPHHETNSEAPLFLCATRFDVLRLSMKERIGANLSKPTALATWVNPFSV